MKFDLNIEGDSFEFSEKTMELIEESFNKKKREQFICEIKNFSTTYLDCVLRCVHVDTCESFKKIQDYLDCCEYLMDNNELSS